MATSRLLVISIYGAVIVIFGRFTVSAQFLSLKELINKEYGEPVAQQSRVEPAWYDRTRQFSDPVSTDPRFNAQISSLLAKNVLDLAHDIGKAALEDSSEKTEVFSPLSIYAALSLLLLGAGGHTFDELMKVMRFNTDPYLTKNPWKIHEEFGLLLDDIIQEGPNPQHPRPQHNWKFSRGSSTSLDNSGRSEYNRHGVDHKITVANGLFVQTGFSLRPDYRTTVVGIYRSNIQNLDFTNDLPSATRYINDWVNSKTEGKIPEIVSNSLSPDTKVVLASALYFNAKWEKTFFESSTGPKNFYPDGLSGAPITVEMMAQGGTFPYYDAKEFDCRILGLPYKHNLTTMYIILPNNSDRTRLRQMQAYLTADKIDDMISRMEWKTAVILFPKLHITNQMNLKKLLLKMEVQSLFDRMRSDLSLISNGQDGGGGYQSVPSQQYPMNGYQQLPSFPVLEDNYKFQIASLADDNDDKPLIFSRHGEDDEESTATTSGIDIPTTSERDNLTENKTEKLKRTKRNVSYKVPSTIRKNEETLRLKDYIISKRITKPNPDKKHIRSRRQTDPSYSLKQLDQLRNQLAQGYGGTNPGLYAEEIVHKIDLTVNEKGTEGGAATVTYLYRTGTDTVFRVETPFIFMIRHDDTKLPLFYGTVFEPTNF